MSEACNGAQEEQGTRESLRRTKSEAMRSASSENWRYEVSMCRL